MIRKALTFVAVLAFAGPALAEQFVWNAATTGITKGDLAIALYQDLVEIADPGITVTPAPNGRDYAFDGLPDVAAGEGTTYELTWVHDGIGWKYRWPHATRTPQALHFAVQDVINPKVLRIAAGDTAIPVRLTVTGLSSDPTGSGVTFTLVNGSTGDLAVDAAAGAIVSATEVVDPGSGLSTWTLIVQYDFLAGDTDEEGLYQGFFRITFPAGGVTTRPPDRSISVRIFP